MLRKIRIVAASLMFLAVTALFLDFTGTIHAWVEWTAKVQFLPALLALNFATVAVLIIVTLLLGRIYCSVVCPLGVMQDIISWLRGRDRKARMRFTYSKEKRWWRYGILLLFTIVAILGIGSLVALLAPYSSYGRIASNLLAPLYGLANNALAYVAGRMDSYAFYPTDIWIKSLPTFIIAAITFVAVAILAWRNGRTYCNTICPVGTILGLISRFSLFRPVFDSGKCKKCSLCARRCKSSCVDFKSQKIDYSRCVACMDCIDACKHGALHLRPCWKKAGKSGRSTETVHNPAVTTDENRRKFLTMTAAIAATTAVSAQKKKVDGGLAVILDKESPKRATPIVPAGALSARDFASHCTGCQLCVSVCPNGVLRPSTDIEKLMQPEMSYERGYCRPECTRCSEVCPAGAIRPISREQKSSIRIGHAVWIRKNCVPLTDGVGCGNCARHCPSGAIQMVPSDASDPESKKIPVVNEERCIGCGACENLCPSRPFSAIYVEGHTMHSMY